VKTCLGTGCDALEKWPIFLKSMILAYYVYNFILLSAYPAAPFLICLLVYAALNMAFYILGNTYVKRGAALLILAAIASASFFVSPVFLLLLPAALADVLSVFNASPVLLCALSLLPLPVFFDQALPYLIADIFTLTVYLLAIRTYGRIARLSDQLDEYRAKNYDLLKKLDIGKEYEEQMRYMSALDVRNKIAQELHDKIGHIISGSIIQLEAAQIVVDSDTAKAKEFVRSVTGLLRSGMDDIRSTLKNIKPPPEMLGYNHVKTLAGEFEKKSGISVIVTCTGDLNRITLLNWRVILDNIGESLTNALKYSKATKIGISIEVYGKLVKCEVRDNGKGAAHIIKGLGVTGMEERAQSAGGNVILDGSSGFSVITLLPVT
jgi:signal transduction histidine kinase